VGAELFDVNTKHGHTDMTKLTVASFYRLVDPGFDGRIILRWFFRKWDVGYGLD
jgi:hypothetical protein